MYGEVAVCAVETLFALSNDKFPEMIIEPAHGSLNDLVLGHKAHRGTNGNSPPDRRFDVLAIVLAAKPPTWNTGSEQYGSVY